MEDFTVKIESLKRHFVVRVQLQPVSSSPPRPRDRFGLKNVTKLLRVLGRFVADLGAGLEVVDAEEVVVGARHDSLGRAAPAALELVEDAVVLVERAEARAEVVVYGEGADGVRLHVHVPHLHVQVVPRQDVAPRRVEVHVRDGDDHLGEEGLVGGVLRLLEPLRVLVAQGAGAHVAEADGAGGAGVDELVAVGRVELRRGDHLGQVLHVRGLYVHDVKRLVGAVETPHVDPQVVGGEECLVVRVHGDGVDVVGVRVREDLPGDGLHREVLVHLRHLQPVGELAGRAVVREEVQVPRPRPPLCDLPQLDGLVVGGEEVEAGVRLPDPLYLVDLLLDLQGLQVVELGLVRLEGAVDVVVAEDGAVPLLVPLEDDHAAALVARGQEFARRVELHHRDDVCVGYVVVHGPFDLREDPRDLRRVLRGRVLVPRGVRPDGQTPFCPLRHRRVEVHGVRTLVIRTDA